jgi:hypothetical protein
MKVNYKILPIYYSRIKNAYLSGISCRRIAKQYSVDRITIHRILRTINTKLLGNSLPKEIEKEIGYRYISGQTTNQIATEFGTTKFRVLGALRNTNTMVRSHSIEHRIHKNINDNFFDRISTDFKAYTLGLLFADGCNSGNKISISLKKCDSYLLRRIGMVINRSNTINLYGNQYPTLIITSFKLAKDLAKYGCVPNKTFRLSLPNLSHRLLWAFTRGYFDGDGSVFKKTGTKRILVTFVGCKKIITELQKFLWKFQISSCIYKHRQNALVYDLKIMGQTDIYRFKDLMYKNATIFMDRKREVFRKWEKEKFI